jgi:hypothetical protein
MSDPRKTALNTLLGIQARVNPQLFMLKEKTASARKLLHELQTQAGSAGMQVDTPQDGLVLTVHKLGSVKVVLDDASGTLGVGELNARVLQEVPFKFDYVAQEWVSTEPEPEPEPAPLGNFKHPLVVLTNLVAKHMPPKTAAQQAADRAKAVTDMTPDGV